MLERAFIWLVGENLLVYSGLIFALLGVASEAGFRAASRRARRQPNREHDREGVGTITAGMMGLLSFTLGLSIGYAQDRAETRRGLVVHEANAIGTAWLRAKLVEGEEGPAIAGLIEELARVELAFIAAKSTEPEAELIARHIALQDRIWGLAQTLVQAHPTTVTTALVTALNQMFDLALAQRFAFDGRVPPTLAWMLLCGALLAIGAMGYQFGILGSRHPFLLALLLTMWSGGLVLVADLNRPRLGSIRVDPAPLIWMIQGFAAPSPPR
jgi:hypothetical protein